MPTRRRAAVGAPAIQRAAVEAGGAGVGAWADRVAVCTGDAGVAVDAQQPSTITGTLATVQPQPVWQ